MTIQLTITSSLSDGEPYVVRTAFPDPSDEFLPMEKAAMERNFIQFALKRAQLAYWNELVAKLKGSKKK